MAAVDDSAYHSGAECTAVLWNLPGFARDVAPQWTGDKSLRVAATRVPQRSGEADRRREWRLLTIPPDLGLNSSAYRSPPKSSDLEGGIEDGRQERVVDDLSS